MQGLGHDMEDEDLCHEIVWRALRSRKTTRNYLESQGYTYLSEHVVFRRRASVLFHPEGGDTDRIGDLGVVTWVDGQGNPGRAIALMSSLIWDVEIVTKYDRDLLGGEMAQLFWPELEKEWIKESGLFFGDEYYLKLIIDWLPHPEVEGMEVASVWIPMSLIKLKAFLNHERFACRQEYTGLLD